MFRSTTKKRKTKTVTRLRSDSDNEGEEQTAARDDKKQKYKDDDSNGKASTKRVKDKSKKSKKKKKGMVVRSFQVGGGDGDDGGEASGALLHSKPKKRKRQGGLGFGGAPTVKVHDDDDDFATANDNDNPQDYGSSSYGRESLEKLKQQQQYKAVAEDEKKVSEDHDEPTTTSIRVENKEDPSLDGDYVPLDGREPSTILTGDEALEFDSENFEKQTKTQRAAQDHFYSVTEESNILDSEDNQQQAQEASAWEAEITRRAGVSSGGGDNKQSTNSLTNTPSSSSAMSLAKLRSQFQSTIAQLETQTSDTERACERRRVELSQTEAELERQQNELKDSGKALEEYQQLREDVTFWAGALRDLKAKVQPIQDALIDLETEIASPTKQQDWEDDMCAVLHQAGLLDQVLGRQPPDFVFEDTTSYVDEFGRDVKSQHAMNREKRMRRLIEIQQNHAQSTSSGPSQIFMDDSDIETFQLRRSALRKALDVALEDLEEEYTRLSGLASIFRKWENTYTDDYKQCFANLSLGDLASVLIQVDICKLDAPGVVGWLEGFSASSSKGESNDSFGWLRQMGEKDGVPSDEVIDRVVEKVYIPIFDNLLGKSGYNVANHAQSRSLGALHDRLSKLIGSRQHKKFRAITHEVFDYIKKSLDNVALAVLKNVEPPSLVDGDDQQEGEQLRLAMHGATDDQLTHVTSLLVNVVKYWASILTNEEGGADFVLDFISTKYLFLLSSLKGRTEKTTEEFSKVWVAVQDTKWLEQPGRMLQAAPLRAAALVFKVS
ncbi:mitochondrial transcription termination [Seminavis robusta]|uniref:Mitochondrial transcription termination n=1 Tax=Seminavis robusta TaxID=568900 RepID=A0A9N8H9Q7_9STRA|nr:mitochondrial transcription termination [Seminavis robusta]|eukprot:Sro287_g108590.1 mitochondrial transcription termination (777) ;mRNA; f:34262-36592